MTVYNYDAAALVSVPVQSANYTAVPNQIVPCDLSGGAFTVTLPTAPPDRSGMEIKIVKQAVPPHGLTVACGGSDVFNVAGGSASGTLTLLNQAMQLQYSTAGAIWYVVSTDAPLPTGFNTQASLLTGGYWQDQTPTPLIWRFADRAFFGDASEKSNGNKFQGTDPGTWLTSQINAFWMEREAGVLSVNPWGGFGGVFASRASDKSKSSYYDNSAIGVVGIVENDDVGNGVIGWAAYLEANREAGNPTVYGCEFAVKNKGNNLTSDPFHRNSWGTIGAWFPAGGDSSYNGAPTNPNNTAIMIGSGSGSGPKSWNRGIVFNSTGITGTDGVTGTGIAIDMAPGHVVRWAISTGGNGADIYSKVATAGKDVHIIFNDDAILLAGQSSSPILSLNQSSGVSPGNSDYLLLSNNIGTGGGSGSVTISTGGFSTNVDMVFTPKGAGSVISSANLSANAFIPATTSTATAAGTTAMGLASTQVQVFTGSTTQTVNLPFAVPAGMAYTIVNQSTGAVTVQSSGANAIVTLATNTQGIFTAQKASPTAAADWAARVFAQGKALTVNKSLTLDGTDGTTMTFPSTSATIARTDAANTFTGHQTIEGVTSTGATGTGKFVFDTSPTLATPLLGTPTSGTLTNCTGLPLGGLAAAAYNTTPTASTLAEWDSNANLSANVLLRGTASTATAAGITTLTIASSQVQVFTGSTTQTVKLPTTSVPAGQQYTIINQSSGAVTVQSSGANTIATLAANAIGVFGALQATPTTAAHWNGEIIVAGKALTVNNSIALAGTDGNTYTFPSSSTGGTFSGSAVAIWDSSGRMNAANFIPANTSTVTAAGTTALSASSNQVQVFTGSTTQTVTLPTTFVNPGHSWMVINNSSGSVTVQSSGGNTVGTLTANTMGIFYALVATPTTAANWVQK